MASARRPTDGGRSLCVHFYPQRLLSRERAREAVFARALTGRGWPPRLGECFHHLSLSPLPRRRRLKKRNGSISWKQQQQQQLAFSWPSSMASASRGSWLKRCSRGCDSSSSKKEVYGKRSQRQQQEQQRLKERRRSFRRETTTILHSLRSRQRRGGGGKKEAFPSPRRKQREGRRRGL